jgi:hypothetical protein
MLVVHEGIFLLVIPEMDYAFRFHARAVVFAVVGTATGLLGCRARWRLRFAPPLPHVAWWALATSFGIVFWHTGQEMATARARGRALSSAHAVIGRVLEDCRTRARTPDALTLVTTDSGVIPYLWRGRALDAAGLTIAGVARGEFDPWDERVGPRVVVWRADAPPRALTAFQPLAHRHYLTIPMQVYLERNWLARNEGRRFARCVTAGLGAPPSASVAADD